LAAPDVKGRHPFHHTNTGGFSSVAFKKRECDTNFFPITSRASLASTGNWKEEHTQPIRNKEQVPESKGKILKNRK
jgi:hypothetical protein